MGDLVNYVQRALEARETILVRSVRVLTTEKDFFDEKVRTNHPRTSGLYFITTPFTPVAGLIFETKIESFLLESFFLERNYCPRTDFSGSNPCSILSHPVNS